MAYVAKEIATSTTKVDIFAGIENTGKYEVLITKVNSSFLASSSGATSSDAVDITWVDGGSSVPSRTLRFQWDSNTPLYVFTSSGNGEVQVILSPVASVGLSVNCS